MKKRQFQSAAKTRSGLVLVAAWFLFLPAGHIFASNSDGVEIPFRLEGHFIVVQGSIGELENLNLVVDTGASLTTLSRQVARRLGLRGKRLQAFAYATAVDVESVRIPSLRLGSVEFQEINVWVAELSFLDSVRGLRIDGLIGLDLLKRSSLTIDYELEILRFGPVRHGSRTLPFYAGLPFLPLSVEVQGEHLRLLLDTGAADLIFFRSMTQGRFEVVATRERREIWSAGGTAFLRKIRLDGLSLAGAVWGEIPAFVLDGPKPNSGVDGVLGPLALGWKRLHLDFDDNLISWE